MNESKYTVLNKVNSPKDLKALKKEELNAYIKEVRSFLINRITESGGHLASNLGAVELSVALHRCFDSPTDRIIFDVGHQSYVHKLITGRREGFERIRRCGGISGFTKRSESEHDPFGAGHSSTSVSAAIGFAKAASLRGEKNYTVAVLGDGAFTGGMVHEALNNISPDLRLIIILNENEMSISKTTGQFAKLIDRIRTSRGYYKTKDITKNVVESIPLIGDGLFEVLKNTKRSLKNSFYNSNFFEDMGLYYLGPVDGNDYEKLEILLEEAKRAEQPTVIHIKTKKGKGYAPAEKNPDAYHSLAPAKKVPCTNYSHAMGDILCEMAREDSDICAITAAMSDGCGLTEFEREFPERFFDVGIAEEHAAVFAAGLAAAKMKPFFAVYSSFLQRSFDNIIHDVALQRLPVTFCIDRAGLAEADGPTHHGIFDVSFLNSVPGVELYSPLTTSSLRECMRAAAESDAPVFIRYANAAPLDGIENELPIKKAGCLLSHEKLTSADALIITYGRLTKTVCESAKALSARGVRVATISLEQLKPIESAAELILSLLPAKKIPLLFVEEGIACGGCAQVLFEKIRQSPKMRSRTYERVAIEDFAEDAEGSYAEYYGFTTEKICKKLQDIL